MTPWLARIGLVLGFAAAIAQAGPVNPSTKVYRIPSDDAVVSLRHFSEQSGEELLYPVDAVRGVRTNPVSGQFTAREALQRLVEQTDLLVIEDEQSGALAIRRKPAQPPARPPERSRTTVERVGEAPDEPANPEAVVRLRTFVVTGSNIPTAADAAAVPVEIIGSTEIARTGLNANLLEILRKRLPFVAGRSNTGVSNANNTNQITAGGSQIAIRNLETLVLINGRRLAPSSVNGIGGKNYVDINQIPTAAIERIEVLADGASAIYGSDAVGGVVNVILKSHYRGVELGARYAVAPGQGRYSERSAYLVAGGGGKGIDLTVSLSWSRTDPLFQKDRPFSRDFTGKTNSFPGVIPGAVLNPLLDSPRQANPVGLRATASSADALIANGTYWAAGDLRIAPGIASQINLAPYQTMLLEEDQRVAMINGSAQLAGRKLVLFGDFLHSRIHSFNQTYQARNNLAIVTVPAGAPYNPLTTDFPGVVFGYLPAPLQFANDAEGNRASAGLRGEFFGGWNWETAFTFDENGLNEHLRNLPYLPNLTRAIAGGYDAQGNPFAGGPYSRVISGFSESGARSVIQPALDPFARTAAIDPASLANIFGTEKIRTTSRIESFDAKLVGSPLALPAGKLGLAFGAATRREFLSGTPDENSTNTGPANHRWGGSGTYFDPFSHGRTVTGYFSELRAPIARPGWNMPGVYLLELTLAGRRDHYGNSADSRAPEASVRWQPVDPQMTVRFSYSEAMTAPPLYAMFGPTFTSTVAPTGLATALGNPAFTGLVFNSLSESNPDLKPTKAWSRSFGVVFSPRAIRGLTLTVDYFNVFQKGFFGSAGSTSIIQSVDRDGASSPLAGNFAFNNYPGLPGAVGVTAPGQISSYLLAGGDSLKMFAREGVVNLSGSHVEAIDIAADYAISSPGIGSLMLSASASILASYEFKAFPDQPFYPYAGYATNGGTGQQGTLPKYHVYSTLEWDRKNWEVTIASTCISAVTDIGAGGEIFKNSATLRRSPVDRYVAWDLQIAYSFGEALAPRWARFVKDLKITVGVNNLFNRMPPAAPQAFTDNNADVAAYSPVGRLVFIATRARF